MSHDDVTKAHGLSTQIKDKPGDARHPPEHERRPSHCLPRSTRRSKKPKKNVQIGIKNRNDKIGNPRTEKKFPPRPDLYCWCHGTQKTHSSPECKVMAAETDEFTPATRKSNQLRHQEATLKFTDEKNEGQGRSILQRRPPLPHHRS
jgi:hypothetical protein